MVEPAWNREAFLQVAARKGTYLRAVTTESGDEILGYMVFRVDSKAKLVTVTRAVFHPRCDNYADRYVYREAWNLIIKAYADYTRVAESNVDFPDQCRTFSKDMGLRPSSNRVDLSLVTFYEKTDKKAVQAMTHKFEGPVPPFKGENRIKDYLE